MQLAVFQEAKRVVVAEIQHITFNEFLPILLGKEIMDKHDLTTRKQVNNFFLQIALDGFFFLIRFGL